MATKVPKVEPRVYNFRVDELPSNSVEPINSPHYAKCIPFFALGEGGLGEHKQLNWLNLYLINHLGYLPDKTTIDQIASLGKNPSKEQLERLIEELPERIQEILSKTEPEQKYDRLIEFTKTMDEKMYEIKRETKELKKQNERILDEIKKLKRHLGCP